jgi:hypothetical protein
MTTNYANIKPQLDELTSSFGGNPFDLDVKKAKAQIEKVRLEIEHLRLENERLRLENENIKLRAASKDNVVIENNMNYNSDQLNKIMEDEDYDVVVIDNTEMLDKFSFKYSNVTKCIINPGKNQFVCSEKMLKYTSILRKLWEMTPRQTIYDCSLFNSKDYWCNKHGYKWIYEIQLSMQMGTTPEILKEMIHICKLMKIEMKMEISLDYVNLDISIKNVNNNMNVIVKTV